MTVETLKQQMQAATGQIEADLIIRGAHVLDVYTETLFQADILIKDGKIVNVDPGFAPRAKQVFDAKGLYAVPAFIEPSMHIDCSLVMPDALAEGFVPWGTTTVVAEVNDLAGYFGESQNKAVEAVKAYFKDAQNLPYRLLGLAPGKCVPIEVTMELLEWGEMFGQGESFGFTTLGLHEDTLKKAINIKRNNLFLNGHVDPFANKDQIGVFSIAGSVNDHEAWSYDALFQRQRRGVCTQLLFSQGVDQIDYMITEALINHKLPAENLLFSADNGYIDDMVNTGILSYLVQRSIQLGVPPITAIKLASFYTARNLGLDQVLGSLAPGRYADILLLPSLEQIKPVIVFKEGERVAENGVLIKKVDIDYSSLRIETEPYLEKLTLEDITAMYQAQGSNIRVSAVTQSAPQYSGRSNAQFPDGSFRADYTIRVINGHIPSCLDQDILKLVFVKKMPGEGKGFKVFGDFVKGFGLKKGAIAMNNNMGGVGVLALGVNEEDILSAVREVNRHPGALVIAAKDESTQVFELPIAGMNSDLGGVQAASILNRMTNTLVQWGCVIQRELYLRFWCLGAAMDKN